MFGILSRVNSWGLVGKRNPLWTYWRPSSSYNNMWRLSVFVFPLLFASKACPKVPYISVALSETNEFWPEPGCFYWLLRNRFIFELKQKKHAETMRTRQGNLTHSNTYFVLVDMFLVDSLGVAVLPKSITYNSSPCWWVKCLGVVRESCVRKLTGRRPNNLGAIIRRQWAPAKSFVIWHMLLVCFT